MSLESKIEALTAAVLANTAALQQMVPAPADPVAVPPPAAPAAPAPVAPPVAEATIPPTPPMPAPPTFAAPAPAPAGAPFTDAKGLVEYAMESYKALGPEKGAGIQNVLVAMGVGAINEVKPEQYATFFAAVEALKA